MQIAKWMYQSSAFTLAFGLAFACSLQPNQPNSKNRHFDRSCSQFYREQRSGEIRFSTHTLPQPHRAFAVTVCSCLCPCPCCCLCSHPERSEGSRGPRRTTALRTFSAGISTVVAFFNPPKKPPS